MEYRVMVLRRSFGGWEQIHSNLIILFWGSPALHDDHVDGIAVALAQLRTDGFPHSEDIADRAVLVFHAHVDDAAVIGDAVKGGTHLDTALAELLPDVPGNLLCLSFKSLFIVDVIGHMDINLLISLDGNGKLWIW